MPPPELPGTSSVIGAWGHDWRHQLIAPGVYLPRRYLKAASDFRHDRTGPESFENDLAAQLVRPNPTTLHTVQQKRLCHATPSLCSYEHSYEYSYERKLGRPGEIGKAAHAEGLHFTPGVQGFNFTNFKGNDFGWTRVQIEA